MTAVIGITRTRPARTLRYGARDGPPRRHARRPQRGQSAPGRHRPVHRRVPADVHPWFSYGSASASGSRGRDLFARRRAAGRCGLRGMVLPRRSACRDRSALRGVGVLDPRAWRDALAVARLAITRSYRPAVSLPALPPPLARGVPDVARRSRSGRAAQSRPRGGVAGVPHDTGRLRCLLVGLADRVRIRPAAWQLTARERPER